MTSKRKYQALDDVVEGGTGDASNASKTDPRLVASSTEGALTGKRGEGIKPSKSKRARTSKTAGTSSPEHEKRGARFKKSCPQNIRERVQRVLSQRFFMIDRCRDDGDLYEEFSVLGSTGNVYKVTVGRAPSCNCPDALKGNHCKHILFVFLKVLKVPLGSNLWYQKALLSSELSQIFHDAPCAPNDTVSGRVREAYAKASSKVGSDSGSGKNRRMPGEEDSCPVCYETMHNTSQASLTFCDTCGNAVHRLCFQQWERSTSNLTCIYCRSKWTAPNSSGGSRSTLRGQSYSEGYINLGDVAGLSPVRDTSTYYHGHGRIYG